MKRALRALRPGSPSHLRCSSQGWRPASASGRTGRRQPPGRRRHRRRRKARRGHGGRQARAPATRRASACVPPSARTHGTLLVTRRAPHPLPLLSLVAPQEADGEVPAAAGQGPRTTPLPAPAAAASARHGAARRRALGPSLPLSAPPRRRFIAACVIPPSRRPSPQERAEAQKTKLCKHFIAGRCVHGGRGRGGGPRAADRLSPSPFLHRASGSACNGPSLFAQPRPALFPPPRSPRPGDGCKFSHDVALYFETKPKDLPGGALRPPAPLRPPSRCRPASRAPDNSSAPHRRAPGGLLPPQARAPSPAPRSARTAWRAATTAGTRAQFSCPVRLRGPPHPPPLPPSRPSAWSPSPARPAAHALPPRSGGGGRRRRGCGGGGGGGGAAGARADRGGAQPH